jgi:hypothetical protein
MEDFILQFIFIVLTIIIVFVGSIMLKRAKSKYKKKDRVEHPLVAKLIDLDGWEYNKGINLHDTNNYSRMVDGKKVVVTHDHFLDVSYSVSVGSHTYCNCKGFKKLFHKLNRDRLIKKGIDLKGFLK